jgi:hypothetical protein
MEHRGCIPTGWCLREAWLWSHGGRPIRGLFMCGHPGLEERKRALDSYQVPARTQRHTVGKVAEKVGPSP